MLREGKAAISFDVADIFTRLGSIPETWVVRMAKLTGGRLLGRFLAASRERLRQLDSKLRVRHPPRLADPLDPTGRLKVAGTVKNPQAFLCASC